MMLGVSIRASALVVAELDLFHWLFAFRLFVERLMRLGLAQPLPRRGGFGLIEIADLCLGEWLAKSRHAMLPFLVPNHGKSFDVREVLEVELDVLPERARFPTVETGHVEQDAQFSDHADETLELGDEMFVIRLGQLAADVNSEHFPAVFFIDLNRHIILL